MSALVNILGILACVQTTDLTRIQATHVNLLRIKLLSNVLCEPPRCDFELSRPLMWLCALMSVTPVQPAGMWDPLLTGTLPVQISPRQGKRAYIRSLVTSSTPSTATTPRAAIMEAKGALAAATALLESEIVTVRTYHPNEP